MSPTPTDGGPVASSVVVARGARFFVVFFFVGMFILSVNEFSADLKLIRVSSIGAVVNLLGQSFPQNGKADGGRGSGGYSMDTGIDIEHVGKRYGAVDLETCGPDRVAKVYDVIYANPMASVWNQSSGTHKSPHANRGVRGEFMQPVWLATEVFQASRFQFVQMMIWAARVSSPEEMKTRFFRPDLGWGIHMSGALGYDSGNPWNGGKLSQHIKTSASCEQAAKNLYCSFAALEEGPRFTNGTAMPDLRARVQIVNQTNFKCEWFCPLAHLKPATLAKFQNAALEVPLPFTLSYFRNTTKFPGQSPVWSVDYHLVPRLHCRHRLSVCSSPVFGGMLSVPEFLARWIAFHLGAGFDHVYIYGRSEALLGMPQFNQFLRSGKVTFYFYPNYHGGGRMGKMAWDQVFAQDHCEFFHQDTDDWLGLMDPDEYFHMTSLTTVPYGRDFSTLVQYLEDHHPNIAGVQLQNSFLRCARNPRLTGFRRYADPMGARHKLIVRPERVWLTTIHQIRGRGHYGSFELNGTLVRHNHLRPGRSCKGARNAHDMWNATTMANMDKWLGSLDIKRWMPDAWYVNFTKKYPPMNFTRKPILLGHKDIPNLDLRYESGAGK